MRYFLGLDLGKKQDYSAFCIAEHSEQITDDPKRTEPKWVTHGERKIETLINIRKMYRWPIGTAYTEIADRVRDIMENPKLKDETALIVDATGVGTPVIEMLAERNLSPIEVWIHGGKAVSRTGRQYSVPKMDLVTALSTAFEARMIKVYNPAKAEDQTTRNAFIEELQNFRYQITNNHTTAAAWRERDHDDLVLAASIAVWYARRTVVKLGTRYIEQDEKQSTYDPFEGL